MKKYAREIILIVIGSALMIYGSNIDHTEGWIDAKKASINIGGILVAIGGILAVIKANK